MHFVPPYLLVPPVWVVIAPQSFEVYYLSDGSIAAEMER